MNRLWIGTRLAPAALYSGFLLFVLGSDPRVEAAEERPARIPRAAKPAVREPRTRTAIPPLGEPVRPQSAAARSGAPRSGSAPSARARSGEVKDGGVLLQTGAPNLIAGGLGLPPLQPPPEEPEAVEEDLEPPDAYEPAGIYGPESAAGVEDAFGVEAAVGQEEAFVPEEAAPPQEPEVQPEPPPAEPAPVEPPEPAPQEAPVAPPVVTPPVVTPPRAPPRRAPVVDPAGGLGAAGAAARGAQGQAAGGQQEGGEGMILPQAVFQGQRVDILEGEIPVLEFVRFLSDYTGLPVVLDSSQQQAQALKTSMITIANRIPNADGNIVKALLEANRWLVFEETIYGKNVLTIESAMPVPTGTDVVKPSQIISVGSEGAAAVQSKLNITGEQLDIRDDERATMIFTLKYTPPSEAINTLNSLVSSGGAPGAQRARSRDFSVVEVRNTQMLIITAKFGLLDYIGKLLAVIDVKVQQPERIIHIIEVKETEVTELVALIESFLQQQTSRGAAARPRTPLSVPAQPGAQQAAAAQQRLPGAAGGELLTTLLADPRTQKIIVQTYSPSDLEDINMLVRELDTRFDIRRLRTRIYRMKFLKAVDVAPVIQDIIGSGAGFSGQRGLGTRAAARGRTGAAGVPRVTQRAGVPAAPGIPGAGGQPGAGALPTLIVAHEDTNSLIVQAEQEEWNEINNILGQIDIKRRQVFLEAALVQVSTSSTLNYAIELLAGEPDDRNTRLLFESSFGLSSIDLENFNRVLSFGQTGAPPPGGLLAVMHRGKFPALVSFFKGNSDSEVLATPFILADDNVQNTINITETRFVVNTSTVNTATTTSQQGEEAGITLEIFPTISSENAVFLELGLEVSDFGQSSTIEVLPPKQSNSISSAVTIGDDKIYVIGGLTRQNKSKVVSKIPLLGDIPLLGKLFRSEGSAESLSNLYIFLRAHILTARDFKDLEELSKGALTEARKLAPDIQVRRFPKPSAGEEEEEEPDFDEPRSFHRTPSSGRREDHPDRYRGQAEDPLRGAPAPREERRPEPSRTPRPRAHENDEAPLDIFDEKPPARSEAPAPQPRSRAADERFEELRREAEARRTTAERPAPAPRAAPAWESRGLRIDPQGESWFVPIRRDDHPRAQRSRRAPQAAPDGTASESWLGANGGLR